jgi:hypothetical protein
MNVTYLQLKPGEELPELPKLKPYLAILVSEETAYAEWRDIVSKHLVRSGCIYMLAWGNECGAWEDAVDLANLEQFNFGEIPEDELVVTTGQKNETLKDVFEFAKNSAEHSCVEFSNTLILHICSQNKETELLIQYAEA